MRTERGYSPHTVANYRRDLLLLCRLAVGPEAASVAARSASGAAGDAGVAGSAGSAGSAASAATTGASPGSPAVREPAWERLTEADVRRWVAGLARDGDGPRTIARRLSAWRGWFDHLARAGRVGSNPVRSVRAPKRPRRLPKALGVDQARQLLDGESTGGPGSFPSTGADASTVRIPEPGAEVDDGAITDTGADAAFDRVRDQAVLELLYSSGLRLSELTSLDDGPRQGGRDGYRSVSWFDRDAAQVTVLGKGGKTRSVPVGRQALAALAVWATERARHVAMLPDGHPGRDEPALFITRAGKRLSNRTIQHRLRQLALRRGIAARVHPHVLRHSFASHLLQSSGDLRAVQELLGHESIATTQVYTSLDFQRLAAVYDSAHPRARRRAGTRSED